MLINGRRLRPGRSRLGRAADINAVPATLIERVDVLTGGASSVYGADAVAGVVNFIMNTNFEGIRLDGQYSFFQHDNSTTTGARSRALNARGFGYPARHASPTAALSTSAARSAPRFDDGRGHVVAYATYRKLNAVTQDKRDYSACVAQATAATDRAISDLRRLGDQLGRERHRLRQRHLDHSSRSARTGPSCPASRRSTSRRPIITSVPTSATRSASSPITRSARRCSPYLEAMFMDDRTVAQIAPSGDFGNTFAINCDNPLLSAQQRAIVCGPAIC